MPTTRTSKRKRKGKKIPIVNFPTGVTHPPVSQLPEIDTPATIESLALANLAARARDGKPLSDADWQRLAQAKAAATPDPAAAALDQAIADLHRLQAEAKQAGKAFPAPLAKLLRDLALRDVARHIWPDVAAAAAELAVSVQTVRNWCDESGIPSARCVIPKADLYRALWKRAQATAPAAASAGTDADQREQELRMLERQARIDERTNRLIAQANDHGRAGLIAAVSDVRQAITNRLPSVLADALAKDTDRMTWEGQARRIIRDHLAAVCADLVRGDTTTPSTPIAPESP